MKYGFIREQQKTYPVTVLCRVMGVSTSAFYEWFKNPGDTDRIRKREVLEGKARQLFYEYKQIYGYRRLSDALGKVGMKSGYYQVRHLMARLELKARYPKRFKVTTNSNHSEAISANTLIVNLMLLLPIKFGQLISLMFGLLKAGFMLLLLSIYFPGKLWVGLLQTTCGNIVRESTTNGEGVLDFV